MGGSVKPSNLLLFLMAFYSVLAVWNNIFAFFLNGIGELNLQLCTAIVAGVINIPLSIVFSRIFGLGSAGVILGTIVSLSIFAILGSLKAIQILKFTKTLGLKDK